ncbi:Serine-threonine/tyrosine-protein kinase, catalytic domain [Dillenia turbinata]|uniref:Serine-threonine/tyrosine-protein kinase, catalytic domain n=1 Tax=Dillenia turbinata TaxID=194707 RepID=A0AAN8UW97_9MAGN
MVMFTSLNSPPQLTKWSSTGGDPCGDSWKGITCSGSAVKEIKLPSLGLTGSLGYQLSSLTSLVNLDVSNNNFGNQMPYGLPPNVQRLNLAGNNFNGGIPYSITSMTSLKYLNMSHNQLQGQVGDMFGQLLSLSTLDLSSNSLMGDLPNSFSSLSSMTNMYLQNNQFTGTINVLANLPLDNLSNGNSWNSGPAPPPPPGTPPASTTKRNHHSNNNSGSNNGGGGGGSKRSGLAGGAVAGIVISILIVGAVLAFFLMKRRSKRSSADVEKLDVQPFTPLASSETHEMKSVQTSSATNTKTYETSLINLRPPPIDRHKSLDEDDFSAKPITVKKANTTPMNIVSYSIADLQMATGSFSIENLLGEGSIGRVYRAKFDDGKVLAVKKINSSVVSSRLSEDFIEMVSSISQLHHPNVIELVGYCAEHGQYLLVYEFHKGGSLHDFLHLSDDYSKPLTWNTRVKIALGTARALEYLHEVCSPSIISIRTFQTVALQVLFQMQISSRQRSEQSLVRWATPLLHDIDALSKMVDPSLKGLYPVKSLSRLADVVALCVQLEPEFRPPMSEVVQALVLLVQRANMSRRTVGNEQGPSIRADIPEAHDMS